MLSRLGRTGWALVAGGALSIPPAVWAQIPTMKPAVSAPGARPAVKAPAAPSAPTVALADEALKIELAWQAEPATFSCHLSAVAVDGQLVARGFVPAESVREVALAMARKATALTVMDGMQVHASLMPRMPGQDKETMERMAREAIREHLGARADKVEVVLKPNGEVVLRGPCESLKEKVALGQAMRRVEGCIRVTNELVPPAPTAPMPKPLVAMTSAKPVVAPVPKPTPQVGLSPWTTLAVQPASATTPAPKTASAPTKPTPAVTPTGTVTLGETYREAVLAVREVFGPRADQMQVAVRPGGQVTLRGACTSAEEKEAAGRRLKQVRGCTEVSNLLVYPGSTPKPLVGSVTVPTPPVVSTPAPQPAAPVKQVKAVEPAPLSAAPVKPRPTPAKPSFADARPTYTYPGKATNNIIGHSPYAGVPSPTTVASTPATPPAPVSQAKAPSPLPVIQQTMAPVSVGGGSSQTATPKKVHKQPAPVASKPMPLPSTLAEPAPTKAVTPPAPTIKIPMPDKPYMTTGLLIMADEELAPPVVGAEPIVPHRLEEAVRNLCGQDAAEVRAVVLPDRTLSLQVKLASADSEKRVMPLLLQLPELAHPNVKLQIQLP